MATKTEQTRADQIGTDLARAAEIERGYRDRMVQIDAELATIEPNVGELVVEAEMSGGASPAATLVERLERLRVERGVAEQAAVAAFERQCVAQHELWQLEGSALRRQADAKRKDAAKHAVKTAELLALVAEHEGCEYAPAMTPVHTEAGPTFIAAVPRSAHMHAEADELDRQADRIEARAIPDGGQVIADSIDELLARVHDLGLVRAPDDDTIREWAAKVAAPQWDRIRRRAEFRGGIVRWKLVWRDGAISDQAHASPVSREALVEEVWRRSEPERTARRAERLEQLVRVVVIEQPGMQGIAARDVARIRMREELDPIERAERRELEATI